MEPPRTSSSWVADAGSARGAANAVLARLLRTPRWWVAMLLIALGRSLWAWSTGQSPARAVWSGFVWTAVITAAVSLGLYALTRRRFARQLAPGTAFEAEFEADHVVLRGPDTEARVAFTGIDRVQRSGDWVLLRQRRSRLTSCWPSALFPEPELVRLTAAVATKS